MDKYDLLEAMSGIRDEYIEEAGRPSLHAARPETIDDPVSAACLKKDMDNDIMAAAAQAGYQSIPAAAPGKRRKVWLLRHWAATAAALVCLSILLPNLSPESASTFERIPVLGRYFQMVTFRHSEEIRDSSGNMVSPDAGLNAQAESVNEITAKSDSKEVYEEASGKDKKDIERSDSVAVEGEAADHSAMAGGAAFFSAPDSPAESSEEESDMEVEENAMDESADAVGAESTDEDVSIEEVLSSASITDEVRKKTEKQILDFEDSISEETGYKSLSFSHKAVTDSDEWLCIAVKAYTTSGDEFEQVDHFVINKKTGKSETLRSWFGEDTDYLSPISNNIIAQIQTQMSEDPSVEYWIDPEEEQDSDYCLIQENQDFYIDRNGGLVICFEKEEIAPASMGRREFAIPREITDQLK